MKYLVTGGAGFIGSHLVDLLVNLGNEVVVFDNRRNGNVNPKARFIMGDIRYIEEVRKAIKGCGAVFHLAAVPRVIYSVEHPDETFDVNVNGTRNVLKAAHEAGVKSVVFASSSTVYGKSRVPYLEDMNYEPLCPYAAQKACCETYMRYYSNLFGMNCCSLRLFSVYGGRSNVEGRHSLVIGKFVRLAMEGKPVEVYGDGEMRRDFTHVSDVTAGFYNASKLKGYNVINLGGNAPVSINELIAMIRGYFPKLEVRYLDAREGEAGVTFASNERAKALLGWVPKVGIKEGLKEYIKGVNDEMEGA